MFLISNIKVFALSTDLEYAITDTGFDINVIGSNPYIEIENISNHAVKITAHK